MKFGEILHSIGENDSHIRLVETEVIELVKVIKAIGADTEKVAETAENLYQTATQLKSNFSLGTDLYSHYKRMCSYCF
ncbi:hypothetical protein ACXYMX_09545 [Sporosarcina sp. CAU 1771]